MVAVVVVMTTSSISSCQAYIPLLYGLAMRKLSKYLEKST